MINVSIITADYLLTQGVNSVVDQYLKNRELFRQHGINICGVYDCRGFYEEIPTRTPGSTDGKVTGSVLQKLKGTFLYKTRLGQTATVLYRQVLTGYRAHKQVLQNPHGEEVLISQDGFASYYYMKNKGPAHIINMTHIHKMERQQLFMNYPKLQNSWMESYLKKTGRYTYEHSAGVVTICQEAKAAVMRDNNCVTPRVIYNSVPDPKMTTAPGSHDKVNFVMASSLTAVKGIDFFIEALKMLPAEVMEQAEFHIYGNGVYYSVLEETCKAENYQNVHLYGNQPAPFRNYGGMDVFLSMSRKETMPMSIVEAMSVGLPVFASDVGAINEMILDGESGKLFNVGAQPLAEGMIYAVSHKNELQAMGERSRKQYVEKFSNVIWVDSFAQMIHEIMEEK